VNWSSAPLLAEYGALFSQATNEFIEAMFTIEPPSRSTGIAARQTWKMPVRFTPSTRVPFLVGRVDERRRVR